MSRLLCVDIDNVLCATDASIRSIIAKETGGRVKLEYKDISKFNYWECTDHQDNCISKEEWVGIHDSFSEAQNILSIEMITGAKDSLLELADLWEIHLVTSRLDSARDATEEWVHNNTLPVKGVHFVKHRQKHLTGIEFDAVLEDDYNQAVEFSQLGVPSILLRHPWNTNRDKMPHLQWADRWPEIVEALSKI